VKNTRKGKTQEFHRFVCAMQMNMKNYINGWLEKT
jgi:hypothetical protein